MCWPMSGDMCHPRKCHFGASKCWFHLPHVHTNFIIFCRPCQSYVATCPLGGERKEPPRPCIDTIFIYNLVLSKNFGSNLLTSIPLLSGLWFWKECPKRISPPFIYAINYVGKHFSWPPRTISILLSESIHIAWHFPLALSLWILFPRQHASTLLCLFIWDLFFRLTLRGMRK